MARWLLIAGAAGLVAGSNSGGLECVDRTVCPSREQCTDDDALYRSGHLCRGFPYYNGGAPIIETLSWDSEDEVYNCTRGRNGVCVEWTTREDSPGEFEVGFGSCSSFDEARRVCMQWRVDQNEVDYCNGGKWTEGPSRQLIDGSVIDSRCCETVCDEESCWTECSEREIEYEFAECKCTSVLAANTGHYCATWHCVEQDNNGVGHAESEDYTCQAVHPTAPVCTGWSGVSDGHEEFELVDCWCRLELVNGTEQCTKWSCVEDGLNYEYPDLDWIAFGVLLGTFFVLAGLGLVHSGVSGGCSKNCAFIGFPVVYLVVLVGVVFPSLIRGGFVVALVTFLWNTLLFAVCVVVLFKHNSVACFAERAK